MTDATTTATTTTATTSTTATPSWYEGKADAETIGHWQNKGWDTADPAKIAIEATKAARSAERHIGVPADRLLKLPEKLTDEAGWKEVYARLGVPSDPKEYDFKDVKRADGKDPDSAFLDSMRSALAQARVPKDRGADVVKAALKHQESVEAAQQTTRAADLAAEKARLMSDWKGKEDRNLLQARLGAQKLGLAPEDVQNLENAVGYAKTMEAMRRVGALAAEDKFVEGGSPTSAPATRQQAAARLAELKADRNWSARLLSGHPETMREWQALELQISGFTPDELRAA